MSDRPGFVKDKKKNELDVAGGPKALLAKEILDLYEEKKDKEARVKEINKILDGYEVEGDGGKVLVEGKYHQLATMLETEGLDLIRLPGIASFWTTQENYPNIVDKEAFIKYLDETGQGAIARRDVNWMTLKGWVNAALKDNIPLPKSINNFAKTKVRFRRSNSK